MKDTIDALEFLTSQHDDIEWLLSELEASDDVEDKADLLRELADMLEAHTTMEEKIFYPAVMAEQTCQDLLEATEEHLAIRRILADMLEMDLDDDHFDAKLQVLKHESRYHTREEEEGTLFPMVRRLLDADQLAGLGNECMALYEQLIDREPRMQISSETGHAAPLDLSF